MDIWIDNRHFKVNNNYTIFQYCAKIGINLPCFCYHERLSIAGNCRICIVEANSNMVISCSTMLLDRMKIFTKNKRIKKAREAVLEFLLVNHPLDCPICDQGGECDLQDILIVYGSDRGRFYELNKRSVTNLNCCGPLIKTVMTRCIHCTRCVRFANEISSIFDFGIIGRGSNMEIGTYILNFLNDELLANIIDLCPVGALISMPSSFTGRNWELKYIQTIDILDSIGSTIRLGVSNNIVMRILPSLDEFYDEWITNKARFVYDSFNIQRLSYPKLKLNFKFIIISWKIALYLFISLLYSKSNEFIQIFCGPYVSLELSYSLKSFFNNIGCFNFFYFENTTNAPDLRYSYLLNNSIKNLSNITDVFLLGCNSRLELPLLNSSIRKSFLNNNKFKAYSIGLGFNLSTFPIINLGSSIKNLYKFLFGLSLVNKYFLFDNFYNIYYLNYRNIINFNFIIGSSSLIRLDSNTILNSLILFFLEFNIPINKLNILSRHLGRISISESNLYYNINLKSNFINKKLSSFNYLLGIDSINLNIKNKINLNIFQGFFYISNFFEYINLVLPSTIFIEESFSFLNLEGRFRYTNKVITPFKFIFTDYNILESLSILIKKIIVKNFSIFNNFFSVIKNFKNLYNFYINYLLNWHYFIFKLDDKNQNLSFKKKFYNLNFYNLNFYNSLFSKIIFNFYNSDVYSKNSKVLSIMSNKINYKNFIL